MEEMNLQKLKLCSQEELTSFFFSFIERLYQEYKVIIPHDKFLELISNFLKDFVVNLSSADFNNIEDLFNLEAREHLNSYLNNSEVIVKALQLFIKNNFDFSGNYQKEFTKIVNYFRSIRFFPNTEIVISLITNIPEFKNVLDNLVSNKEEVLKKKGLNAVFRNELAIFIGEVYCNLNNIEYKDYLSDEELISGITDDSVKMYLHEIGQIPLLSREEERELGYLILEKKNEAYLEKQRFIEANLRLVVSIAKKYLNHGVDFLDLINEGNIGLMKAVDRFDVTKGYKFSIYATWLITQAIRRYIAFNGRSLRIPAHMYEFFIKVNSSIKILTSELGRPPLDAELADYLDVPITKIEDFNKYGMDATSLNQPYNSSIEDGGEIEDFIIDENNSHIEDEVIQNNLKEMLEMVMDSLLSDKQKEIIKRRFGYYGEEETLEEIAASLGVTRERVRQIAKKALHILSNSYFSRNALVSFTDDEYLEKIVEMETNDLENREHYLEYRERIKAKKLEKKD